MRTGMKRWQGCCWLLLGLLVLALLVTVGWLLLVPRARRCSRDAPFSHAAVAADSLTCSLVGRDILQKGGSAVDAAISALLCSSLVQPQSLGIGGGAIHTIYHAATGRVVVINAREVAPKNVHPDIFSGCGGLPLKKGAQWIGVPGEIQGYWEAHQRFGKLPWKLLFEPSIQLAREGLAFPTYLKNLLIHPQLVQYINNSPVAPLVFNRDGSLRESLQYPQLAKTLEVIAEKGPKAFYNGTIMRDLINDIKDASAGSKLAEQSTLTEEDFRQYRVRVVQPLNTSLGDYTMYTPPWPSRGAILSFVLKILEGFNFSPQSLRGKERVQTSHRIIEALKFGNGQLTRVNQTNMPLLLSEEAAAAARQHIDDKIHPPSYYSNNLQARESYGTSHVSVVDSEGNAVSVTSSINHIFGSVVYSPRTGIILNNQLVDFCGSETNGSKVAGRQPPSSMSPSILVSKDKGSVMVVGAAGGTMILGATAQVIMNKLWFGLSLKDAIGEPRIDVKPNNSVVFEEHFNKDVVEAMKRTGHELVKSQPLKPMVQGIFRDHGCIEAVSDLRKFGKAAGD